MPGGKPGMDATEGKPPKMPFNRKDAKTTVSKRTIGSKR